MLAFYRIKEKNSLNDKQFMMRERFLKSDKSFGLTISNRAGSVNLKTDHFELKPLKEPLKSSCYYPFYKVLIDHDGTLLMCSNDWKKAKPLGNILKASLLVIPVVSINKYFLLGKFSNNKVLRLPIGDRYLEL